MGPKEIKLIVKILLIIGVINVGLSFLVPWLGIGGFVWGVSFLGQTSMFYFSTINAGGFFILLTISSLVTFFMVLGALILGIMAIPHVDHNKPKTSMKAGILSLISMIFFAIMINIGFSAFTGGAAFIGNFSPGFYMMITPIIMFFAAYGLQINYLKSPTPPPMTQQPPYQQQAYQQPATPQPVQPPPPPMSTVVTQPPQVTPPPTPAAQPQTDAKFCAECGTKLEPHAMFCPECGAKK